MHKVVIIGSGPAGLTAALYCARANLAPLVVEGIQAGGQLTLTTDVENYPGFPQGIMGPQLMTDMREQAARFGTEFLTEDVTAVNLKTRPFTITIAEKPEIETQTVIVSTGATALMLNIDSEQQYLGQGVSTCATCDGAFFKEKELIVVGGGDSAMEEGTFLTKFASTVTIVHRRNTLRASKIMQERAFRNEKVKFIWDSVVEEVYGDGVVQGVKLRNLKTTELTDKPCSGVFIAIGHTPTTTLFVDQLDMDPQGYLLTHDGTKTNIPGVFAAGDVQDHVYRQAVTAAGSGCMAAIDVERFLEQEAH
ncbi:MAG TPA: thioredoxin-disulfide reductase [Nitrospirales bacterium]|nr:thioredoxin-disulfide reductase [Nitrospirales bacterium]HIA14693.1 thioredoxin-disulfide reductase [Nitrospirales bacterium]HIB54897.1 thioredoxin-disulfide reductase [Nitrospirales bacterium]HIN32439.1 thioredoxin-disulfide reductase [Nitrospirales bacterium]HIO22332.1 thioredoxin-disulfide reductase [Nitrospirales bacterium]